MENTSNPKPSPIMMIVEDNQDSLEILTVIVHKKFPEITVFTAMNGREGVELFDRHPPDIVLTDINMPEMGGIEMARRIREMKPDTRIIVLTADQGKAALEGPAGTGFEPDHYVFKPVEYQQLFFAIEQCMGITEDGQRDHSAVKP
jgi:YesN/AraC family two-component response regulator